MSSIPSELNNHSVDGSRDTFLFLDKKISGLNLCRHDITRIFCPGPNRFINTVLDMYNVILDVLSTFEIKTPFEKE